MHAQSGNRHRSFEQSSSVLWSLARSYDFLQKEAGSIQESATLFKFGKFSRGFLRSSDLSQSDGRNDRSLCDQFSSETCGANIEMDDARTTKRRREKRKLEYKFIGGACLVGVGSDVAPRGQFIPARWRGSENAGEREKTKLQSRDQVIPLSELSAARGYLQSVLFFFPHLESFACASCILSSRPRDLSPKWTCPASEKGESEGLLAVQLRFGYYG